MSNTNVNQDSDKEQFISFKDRGDLWKDITPIDEFSNEVNILKIAYSDEIKEINDYFRAVLKKNEISLRAFNLTTELLERAATNYMGWYHRRLCIDNLNIDLNEELEFLDSIMEENQKNYQIWHHRKAIVEKSQNPSKEKPILNLIFEDEPKNFHAWCHRIWVVRRFNLTENESEFTDVMLKKDCRNNSAWNYRYFLFTFENEKITKEIFEKELRYTLDKIQECPNNESPYNYIRGLFQIKSENEKDYLFKFSEFPFVKETLESVFEKNPKVYHCLALILDMELEAKNKDKCAKMLDNLVEIDYIRKKYWLWRKQNLRDL